MKTKGLRIFCFLLAVLMLSTALVSCGKDDNEEETKPNKQTSDMANAPVPHYDWGGRIFKVLSVGATLKITFDHSGNLTKILIVEEKFGMPEQG